MAERSPARALLALGLLAALCTGLYLTLGVQGSYAFALGIRGQKLAAMLLTALAVAASTMLFQTATGNRILTPAIMGFDALYVLIQTVALFFWGSGRLAQMDRQLAFLAETALMIAFSGLLYWSLFLAARRSLHQLVLAGVVFGALFRSIASLLQRLIDPDEFLVLQERVFATFAKPDMRLMTIAGGLMLLAGLLAWRRLAAWDVMALGREAAINLGLDHRREVLRILVIVSILVSVSTALVGPVTFFGLLVAHLAYQLVPSHRHAHLLPAAFLLAAICLIGGQTLLERVFLLDANIRVIIEFLGGLTFLALLLRRGAR